MSDVVFASLISSLISGVLVAILHFLFTSKKTQAEIKRLEVETRKITEEPLRLVAEMEEQQKTRLQTLEATLRTESDTKIRMLESQLRNLDLVRQARWKLKYEACLQALKVVDGMFSNMRHTDKDGIDITYQIVKQSVTTEEARECAGKLILTCDSAELIDKFMEIARGQQLSPQDIQHFRNLVRRELWEHLEIKELASSDELIWIASVTGDPKIDKEAWQRHKAKPDASKDHQV